MNETELEKGIGGRDALDNEGGEVIALLSALPRVEAPGNFEFGVRARIAAGREVKTKATLTPFLKVFAPLTLILVVTGFVFFYGMMRPANTPEVANVQEASPAAVASAPLPVIQSDPFVAAAPSKRDSGTMAQRSPGPIKTVGNARPKPGRSIDMPFAGGSLDSALGGKDPIVPRGFQSANSRRPVNANIGSTTEVPVKEVLGILGINSEFVDGICKVGSVTDNSLGARAGVKTGDVIETVDGRAIKSDMKLNGVSGGKIFSVRRDGKRLNLTIGN